MNFFQQLKANHAPGPYHEPAGDDDLSADELPVRLIAHYLPQFHPIPENDAWWGTGFTEWTNVTKALPQYRGHYQPRLPADMGFYDLRLPEILQRQAQLARRHGVHGFSFYLYWFGGRRVLERPLQMLLDHPEIDLPFCVTWANENWTRTWDGGSAQILLAQSHSPEDDLAFIESLIPMLRDPRYIRVDGRPLIMLYRADLLPETPRTMARWRERLIAEGLGDPLLVMTQTFGLRDPRPFGMDAAAEFPPHNTPYTRRQPFLVYDPAFIGDVVEYEDTIAGYLAVPDTEYPVFRGVMPSWDNSARRAGRGTSFRGSTPQLYGAWLASVCRRTLREHPPGHRIVFVNAWNEWAEGAHLEPDRHFGHAYLRTTARVLRAVRDDDGAFAFSPVTYDRSMGARARRAVRQQRAHVHNVLQRFIQRRSAGAGAAR